MASVDELSNKVVLEVGPVTVAVEVLSPLLPPSLLLVVSVVEEEGPVLVKVVYGGGDTGYVVT